jgi:glutathione S-transferase
MLRVFMTRALGVTPHQAQQSREAIEAFAAEIEERLCDGRTTLLGGDLSYVDISMAALSGAWVRCDNYGGGKAANVRVPIERCPEAMQQEVKAWQARFPRLTDYVRRLYEEERLCPAG